MKTSNKIIEWNKAFKKIVRSGSKPTQAKIKYEQSLKRVKDEKNK